MCGGGSTTTTTKPFKQQRMALSRLFDTAEDLYEQGPDQFFPGQSLASVSPDTLAAQEMARGAIEGQQQIADANRAALSGMLDPNSAAGRAATQPFIDRLQKQILPGIGSTAIRQGAFGGSRQRIQEEEAGAKVADAATQAILRNQANAMRFVPSAQASMLAPSRTLDALGRAAQGREQMEIQDAMRRFQYAQQAPQTALDRLASRITGTSLGTINQQQIPSQGMNQLLSAAGLGLAGYGLFKQPTV
tara:strand:+ start:15165 stop:15905 length:741 start_codon:yes stop_codon:yes gene_type:complete